MVFFFKKNDTFRVRKHQIRKILYENVGGFLYKLKLAVRNKFLYN
jgi:hypothetical protein